VGVAAPARRVAREGREGVAPRGARAHRTDRVAGGAVDVVAEEDEVRVLEVKIQVGKAGSSRQQQRARQARGRVGWAASSSSVSQSGLPAAGA